MNLINDIDMMQFVGRQESQFLCPLSDFEDKIIERLSNGVKTNGENLPWHKAEELFRFRPHEITIWAGINGHGKSMVTSHVMAHLMKQSRCVLASLEMEMSALGERLIRQISGNSMPTTHFSREVIQWTKGRLWVYDQQDTVEHQRIIGMCVYAFTVLKVDHIFIDSLMKCGMDDDDYNAQKKFVDRLCWIAKTHGGHIHLVAHMRKGKTEYDMPDKFDILGGSSITNLVDNIAIVFRNKAKEENENLDKMVPDSVIKVVKQRHGEWEGKINLWFDKPSQQFKGSPDGRLEWFQINKPEPVKSANANSGTA